MGASAFRGTLGIRDGVDFEATNPTAHTLACLRFAGLVAETVARLATGSGGLPFAGRVSHPRWTTNGCADSDHAPLPGRILRDLLDLLPRDSDQAREVAPRVGV